MTRRPSRWMTLLFFFLLFIVPSVVLSPSSFLSCWRCLPRDHIIRRHSALAFCVHNDILPIANPKDKSKPCADCIANKKARFDSKFWSLPPSKLWRLMQFWRHLAKLRPASEIKDLRLTSQFLVSTPKMMAFIPDPGKIKMRKREKKRKPQKRQHTQGLEPWTFRIQPAGFRSRPKPDSLPLRHECA